MCVCVCVCVCVFICVYMDHYNFEVCNILFMPVQLYACMLFPFEMIFALYVNCVCFMYTYIYYRASWKISFVTKCVTLSK